MCAFTERFLIVLNQASDKPSVQSCASVRWLYFAKNVSGLDEIDNVNYVALIDRDRQPSRWAAVGAFTPCDKGYTCQCMQSQC